MTAINDSGDDYVKLQELAVALKQVEASLELAMSRWVELAERAS